ncbi:MAG: biotin/lipoyl-binding protein [Alphaproteobacteria bacterium]|nr:biotin/lipoyl-binding protein [Alphaproteobacteria bacterium]
MRGDQRVAIGDVLFRIDDRPYHIALAEAEARLAGLRDEIESLKGSYRQKQEELALAQFQPGFRRDRVRAAVQAGRQRRHFPQQARCRPPRLRRGPAAYSGHGAGAGADPGTACRGPGHPGGAPPAIPGSKGGCRSCRSRPQTNHRARALRGYREQHPAGRPAGHRKRPDEQPGDEPRRLHRPLDRGELQGN